VQDAPPKRSKPKSVQAVTQCQCLVKRFRTADEVTHAFLAADARYQDFRRRATPRLLDRGHLACTVYLRLQPAGVNKSLSRSL